MLGLQQLEGTCLLSGPLCNTFPPCCLLPQAVWLERDLMRVPQELGLPLECLAMSKELCLAYCLLERHGSLKVSRDLPVRPLAWPPK